jgi:DNA-binding NtrC family response regulator
MASASRNPHVKPPTVLIVDDEELVRWSLRERLLERGFRVLVAGTLAVAREHLSAGGIDVALLDLRLPDGEGLALLDEPGSPAAAILMTAHRSVEVEQ